MSRPVEQQRKGLREEGRCGKSEHLPRVNFLKQRKKGTSLESKKIGSLSLPQGQVDKGEKKEA